MLILDSERRFIYALPCLRRDSTNYRLYQLVGESIAAARSRANPRITQDRLAELTGGQLSRSAIANMERGRQRIALHHLYLLAKALKISPIDLLPDPTGTDQVNPKVRDWLMKIDEQANPDKEAKNA